MNKNRIYGLDILRLLVVIPDVCFNTTELIEVPEQILLKTKALIPLISYIRVLYFAGFISMFVAFFILGLKSENKIWTMKRFLIVVPGILIVSFVYQGNFNSLFELEWEFYHLILVGLFVCSVIRLGKDSKMMIAGSTIISAVCLLIPFWKFEIFNNWGWQAKIIVTGVCDRGYDGAWPVLPWIFLISLAYSMSIFLKNYFNSSKISKVELLAWLIPIVYLARYWGAYYILPSDDSYTCSLFRNGPLNFISHMLPVFFFARISFVEKVNNFFGKNLLVRSLGKFKWIDQFGLSYVLSFIIIGALSIVFPLGESDEIKTRDFVIVSTLGLVLTELVLRLSSKLQSSQKINRGS